MNYKKATIWVIIISSAIRLTVASAIYLGVDEVYYRQFANCLQINYLDHPPMVAILIRLTTLNLLWDNDVTIRLGAIICAAAATWVIYLSGKLLHSNKAGYFAAVLYSTNIFTSILAGTFILPDSPQVLFYVIGLHIALKITIDKQISTTKIKYLFVFALMVGLAFLCKINAVFLWFGFLLYCIMYHRAWLSIPYFYVAIVVSSLFAIPLLYWNIQHNFITFIYHTGRVSILNSAFNFNTFLQFTLGKIAYSNVVFIVLFALAIKAYQQGKTLINKLHYKLLLCCIVPIIMVALVISLFNKVLPHWTGQAFIPMILLTAVWLAHARPHIAKNTRLPNSIKLVIALYIIVISVGLYTIKYLPSTLGSKNYARLGSNDFTADLVGWQSLQAQMEKITTRINDKSAIIICNGWFPGAHVQHYIASPLHIPLIAIGPIEKIHQYYWWNKKVNYTNQLINAYIIKPSNYSYADDEFTFLQNKIPASIDTLYNMRNKYLVNYYVIKYYRNLEIN